MRGQRQKENEGKAIKEERFNRQIKGPDRERRQRNRVYDGKTGGRKMIEQLRGKEETRENEK